jgi:hypothetical protein
LFQDPGVLVLARFALDENGPEFALLSERVDGRFIERLLVFVQKLDEARGGCLGHFGKNFVGLEHTKVAEVRGEPDFRKANFNPARGFDSGGLF